MSERESIVVRMADGSIWLLYDDIEALAASVIRAQGPLGSAQMLGLRTADGERIWLNAGMVVSIAPRSAA